MEPLVTLHHFVHPQWFEALGAFEREENIGLFLDWCRVAFRCALATVESPQPWARLLLEAAGGLLPQRGPPQRGQVL